MSYLPLRTTRRTKVIAATLAATLAIGGGTWLVLMPDSFAQDTNSKGDKIAHPKTAQPQAEKPEAAPPAAPAAPRPPTPPDFAVRLKENGAGTCAAQVNAMATSTMAAVKQFDIASGWAVAGGDKRVVTVSIGQKYADGSPVPFSATSVLAAPDGRGSCDAVAVQVVPSPLSCSKLRDSMSAHGRQVGNLAGVLLMQDASGQTMLVPTAPDTCVLIGLQAAYAH